jgi:hypothetical protein
MFKNGLVEIRDIKNMFTSKSLLHRNPEDMETSQKSRGPCRISNQALHALFKWYRLSELARCTAVWTFDQEAITRLKHGPEIPLKLQVKLSLCLIN